MEPTSRSSGPLRLLKLGLETISTISKQADRTLPFIRLTHHSTVVYSLRMLMRPYLESTRRPELTSIPMKHRCTSPHKGDAWVRRLPGPYSKWEFIRKYDSQLVTLFSRNTRGTTKERRGDDRTNRWVTHPVLEYQISGGRQTRLTLEADIHTRLKKQRGSVRETTLQSLSITPVRHTRSLIRLTSRFTIFRRLHPTLNILMATLGLRSSSHAHGKDIR